MFDIWTGNKTKILSIFTSVSSCVFERRITTQSLTHLHIFRSIIVCVVYDATAPLSKVVFALV